MSNRYKQYMERVPDSPAVEENALAVQGGGPRRRPALTRYAGIAAALALLLGGGAAAWWVTGGLNGLLSPGVSATSVPSARGNTPENIVYTTFVPFEEYNPISFWNLWIPREDLAEATSEAFTPVVLQSMEELNAYSVSNPFSFSHPDDHAPIVPAVDVLDFEKNVMICWFPGYVIDISPMLSFEDDYLGLCAHANSDAVAEDGVIQGFFFMVDRKLLGEREVMTITADYGFEGEYDDVTPDTLREKGKYQVYKHTATYESYLVRQTMSGPLWIHIGVGFGGMGINDIHVTEDGKYLIYAYSWGSGMHRSHIGITPLENPMNTHTSSPMMMMDVQLELLEDGRWGVHNISPYAVMPEYPLIAYLTVTEDGVWYDVLDENAFQVWE